MEETVENVEELNDDANSNLKKGKPVYVGLMGTSGLGEIDQDVVRLQEEDSTLVKDYHLAFYVDGSDGQSAHDVARDAERVLIRKIGLDRLLNKRNGGAGRPPRNKSVGGIFIIVIKTQKKIQNKRKPLVDLSNTNQRKHK